MVVAGRPNVGKSTLVNRIVGRRAAVVEERPGVTRDRKELDAEWCGHHFTIVDTGGWLSTDDPLDAQVSAQSERAIAEADVILFVVDVTVGLTDEDLAVARVLKHVGPAGPGGREQGRLRPARGRRVGRAVPRTRRPVAGQRPPRTGHRRPPRRRGPGAARTRRRSPSEDDGPAADADGLVDLVASVAHDRRRPIPRVALVGRPNVGKSTLFNRLVGDERSVTHDAPGTTRDAVDTIVETPEGTVCFIDTAGMRRKSRTERGTEYFSVLRALDALDRADIALLVIDATAGITHQDQRLAERIGGVRLPGGRRPQQVGARSRPRTGSGVLADVGDRLAFLGEAPVLKISALSGLGVHHILPAVAAAEEAYHSRIPTGELNRALKSIQVAHPPVGARIQYGVQGANDPPTFTLFTNGRLQPTYLRYVERGLRERFDLGPTPIKIRVRAKGANGGGGRKR